MRQENFLSLCQPLFDYYGFNYCAYYQWYSNTKFSFLSTDMPWEQVCLSNNHYQATKNQLPNGNHILTEYIPNELLAVGKNEFNYNNLTVFIKHYHHYTDQFYLALPMFPGDKTNICLMANNALKKFFFYLKSNTHLTFNMMEKHHLKLAVSEVDCHDKQQKKEEFLKKIACRRYCLTTKDAIKILTKRQTLVLILFTRGCSIKAIARKLDCSPNTIYTHLTDIKSSLQCYSKDELIEVARNNDLHLLELDTNE